MNVWVQSYTPLLLLANIYPTFYFPFQQQQKFLKRPLDDTDSTPDSYEPPVKVHGSSENLTKFSVEIVQQLEFTTSSANSQPQQISTNVTVKALTNVKSEGSQSSNHSTNQQQQQQQDGLGRGECFCNYYFLVVYTYKYM
jgi:hypothetical protein